MKKTKAESIEVSLKVQFDFAYIHNAQSVAVSLASTGYLVSIKQNGTTFTVYVYTTRTQT